MALNIELKSLTMKEKETDVGALKKSERKARSLQRSRKRRCPGLAGFQERFQPVELRVLLWVFCL